MLSRILMISGCFLMHSAWGSANLTSVENKWLSAALPVLAYAKQQKLPIDIVVQPDDRPGDAPLAMGYADGRCKMVLSMRGNPQVELTLAKAPAELALVIIEAMVAHEVGHCWRYVQGSWHTLPAGFVEAPDDSDEDKVLIALKRDMRETRREEGLADLVGLAWTLVRHPQHYAQVHAWFEAFRSHQPVEGSHHDTRAWIRIAKDPTAFPAASTPFERAHALWQRGLLSDD